MTASHRISLQAAWTASPDGGTWTRSFGRPTGVGPEDRVWLVVERPAPGAATLNGRPLPAPAGDAAAWRHDVTDALRDRNELCLLFGAPIDGGQAGGRAPLPGRLGGVSLEIVPRG